MTAERMPISRRVRRMRTAISPRLAISTFFSLRAVGGGVSKVAYPTWNAFSFARSTGSLVRSAEHLDRDDALVREPFRQLRHRRAALQPLSEGHRPPPSRPGRGDRPPRERLAEGGRLAWWPGARGQVALVPEAHGPPPAAGDRQRRSPGGRLALAARKLLPDPRAARDARLARQGDALSLDRRHRPAAAGGAVRSDPRPPGHPAAGDRRARRIGRPAPDFERAVRPRGNRFRRVDARLGPRPAGDRRHLGRALVRGGRALDRLCNVPAEGGRPARAPGAARRTVLAPVRSARRASSVGPAQDFVLSRGRSIPVSLDSPPKPPQRAVN